MTTVIEFIEYLKTLPADTEVSVVRVYDCGYSKCAEEVNLNIAKHVEFMDFTNNQCVKEGDTMFGKKYLTLGIIE